MSANTAEKRQTIRDPREVKVKRALLSVSDKEGLIDFAKALAEHGVEIL